MTDFLQIDYLKDGNPKQQMARDVLTASRLMEHLSQFDPILVGTIPINIDIENSDLDVICYFRDRQQFVRTVIENFGNNSGFRIREDEISDIVIANFFIDDFEIEVFGQHIPSKLQHGYRHMLVEYQLLCKYEEDFRVKIIELKRQGYKTEPALGMLLKLSGNPYEELLKLESTIE